MSVDVAKALYTISALYLMVWQEALFMCLCCQHTWLTDFIGVVLLRYPFVVVRKNMPSIGSLVMHTLDIIFSDYHQYVVCSVLHWFKAFFSHLWVEWSSM